MFYNATLGVETRSRKRKRERDANAGEVIPGLLNDILVTHVLRSEYFDDPADLARLRVVSPAMRGAVAATGLRFVELYEDDAVKVGCLSAVERLQRRGILGNQSYLCHAAARSGQLEKLKVLRENDTPWDEGTCAGAACGGHLKVLQWLRANGCPWNEWTCSTAAGHGQLEVLQWARENGCPWDELTCAAAAYGGEFEVLKWLRKNGCPWDGTTQLMAAENGHDAIVEWANANGAPTTLPGV